jgi:hypothetical protein
MALPNATSDDFSGTNRRPAGVHDDHLKVIKDTSLRSRLILGGFAEGLQSPKGPQKIASIIRIYPAGDAPKREVRPRGPRGVGRPRGSRSTAAPERARGAFGLPTIEDLQALVTRVRDEEGAASARLQGEINNSIDRIKREIGTLEGDDFERAYRELENQMRAKRQVAGQIREEAFRVIENDDTFAPRQYLRLVSRERQAVD